MRSPRLNQLFGHGSASPILPSLITLGTCNRCRLLRRSLGEQASDSFRHLSALGSPVLDAVAFEENSGGIGARIVGAHDPRWSGHCGPGPFSMTTTRYWGCLRAPTRAKRIINTGVTFLLLQTGVWIHGHAHRETTHGARAETEHLSIADGLALCKGESLI